MAVHPEFEHLTTFDEVMATRRATPKWEMTPKVLATKERKQSKKDKDEAFREDIWTLDKGCSRATGRPLVRGGTTEWDRLGEVDHVINRSTAPELVYERSNGILLSKMENRLKKTPCPQAPEFYMFSVEGPDDRRLLQTFTWRDKTGRVTRRTVG